MAKYKRIVETDIQSKILSGVKKAASIVGKTLGPRGENIGLLNGNKAQIVNDGITIAKHIEFEDEIENYGAKLVIAASSKTNDVAGDGTTTSVILTHKIYEEAIKGLTLGEDKKNIINGIEIATNVVLDYLSSLKKDIKNDDEILGVATISANNDPLIGKLIFDAIKKVGKDGIIEVEESKDSDTVLELTEGMEFDNGYLSPYFITNTNRGLVEFKNPRILCYDGEINTSKNLTGLLQASLDQETPLLILADDVKGEALQTLVYNKMRTPLMVCAVKSPGFGDGRKQKLEDIAILTGTKVVGGDTGIKLQNVKFEELGTAEKIKINRWKTTIINGAGTEEAIKNRIKQIEEQIESMDNDFDKEAYRKRIAKLGHGVAVIRVGGTTEEEMQERKLRIEDAINATKAALSEGILPGAGTALYLAAKKLNEYKINHPEHYYGATILENAISEPIKILIKSAMLPETAIREVKKIDNDVIGPNVKSKEMVPLLKDGVIDPYKVVKAAFTNAVSSALLLFSMGGIVLKIKLEDDKPIPMN